MANSEVLRVVERLMIYCKAIPTTGRCLSPAFIDEVITSVQEELTPVGCLRTESTPVGKQFFLGLLLSKIRRLPVLDQREALERFEDELAALRLEIVAAPETVAMSDAEIRAIIDGAKAPSTVTVSVEILQQPRVTPWRSR